MPFARAASISASAFVAGAPAARAVDFQVRDLRRGPAGASRRRGSFPRSACFELRSFVAHVRGVDAAGIGGDVRELDDLRLVRVGARHVLQTGREPDGAVRHRLPDERLHPRQSRRPLGRRFAVPMTMLADGVVTDRAWRS